MPTTGEPVLVSNLGFIYIYATNTQLKIDFTCKVPFWCAASDISFK